MIIISDQVLASYDLVLLPHLADWKFYLALSEILIDKLVWLFVISLRTLFDFEAIIVVE
jgi:hypothetical protein